MKKPKLLFVSPRFLLPADSGGKIRTTQILRGMKNGAFEITLISPATELLVKNYATDLAVICDHFFYWEESGRGLTYKLIRLLGLLSNLPIPVFSDRSSKAYRTIQRELNKTPDLVVFDFLHSAVNASKKIKVPSLVFTHNVEAEIFRRHFDVATGILKKFIWKSQYLKMRSFEKFVLQNFDTVVAVSQRDAEIFCESYGLDDVETIPTGVDLEYFKYQKPSANKTIVFTGAMDWMANIDGIEYFLEDIWPNVMKQEPDASMLVVGRNPPQTLVDKVRKEGINWRFTGFVDDIRPHVATAALFIIPLRVGGGTRIKAFEAMAMGCPVVSTSIGIEGLAVDDGEHYVLADDSTAFSSAIVRLLRDVDMRKHLSSNARKFVEEKFSYKKAAAKFEEICIQTLQNKKLEAG